MQCVTLRVTPVLTSTTRIRLPWQCERRHPRWKATLVPSGDHAGEPSLQPSGGWVIWRMWLPLGYIVKMASRRTVFPEKAIRPSVEAVPAKLLALFLSFSRDMVVRFGELSGTGSSVFSWPAPPLAASSPLQAANNSREQSPMMRPITSTTRLDGFPISEWYMSLLLLYSLSRR